MAGNKCDNSGGGSESAYDGGIDGGDVTLINILAGVHGNAGGF